MTPRLGNWISKLTSFTLKIRFGRIPTAAIILASSILLVLAGCGGSSKPPVDMATVVGTVKFADGSVPQGQPARIIFDPVRDPEIRYQKMASAEIGPDGKYELFTLQAGDGVMPGKYKVLLEVRKEYGGTEMLVPAEYLDPATTPLPTAEVVVGENTFDFTDIAKP